MLSYLLRGIQDKTLKKLVRTIIFGSNAVTDWERVQKLIFTYMPELKKYSSFDEFGLDQLDNRWEG